MRDDARNIPGLSLHLGMLFLLWLLVYGAAIFRPALLDDADSVHAEAAREILLRHDWVTLHVNGIRYLEKAPLLYWTIAGSFSLFGVHDWSARLPLALGVLALICSVYFVGRRIFAPDAGFWAALAASLALGPYIFTRFLIPDVLVGLWFTLSLGFFLFTFENERPSRWSCWGFAAACALNVLTKGLIGLVFPFAAIVVYLLLTRQLRHILRMRLISSSLVFLAIAAPWHILAGLRNPTQGSVRGFFWFYFINEHFLRYLNKRVPRDYDTVPLLLFWGLVIVWLFPWSTFLPQALKEVPLFRPSRWSESSAMRAGVVFTLGALFIILFFSFSTRQEYYVLPALPALALVIGSSMAKEQADPDNYALRRWANACSVALAAVGLLACIVMAFLALSSPASAPAGDIADLLHSGPAESQQYALSLGHFLDLNRRVMPLFRTPLLLFGLAVFAGSALNWYFRRRARCDIGDWSLAAMSVCLLIAVHLALVTFSPILTSKPLADAIARVYEPGDIIEINGEYEGGSTLNYYTGHQVRILNGRSANLWYGSYFPDAPQIFDDSESFQLLWNGPQRVFLWTENEKLDEGVRTLDPKTVFLLARSGGKAIVTNKAAH
ncbi:MAG TPA: glycosyltransferase family 39 protein [Terriglobales bacterium]|nr:glycosyltransferase family 39 protein [Terriglobales bacterium]